MPSPRGRTGEVRGLRPEEVRALMAQAVQAILARDISPRGMFSRASLRGHFREAQPKPTEEQVRALEHAFWRTVAPVRYGSEAAGAFLLPRQVAALVEHRDFRLDMPRLALADILQLPALVRLAEAQGVEIADGLKQAAGTCSAALEKLKLPNAGELHRA